MIDLSIIIPFHNAAESILQTLKALDTSTVAPLEIILVNDASMDNTVHIINQFVSQTDLLTHCFPSSANKRGAAAARNLGAQQAKGKILLFIDADVVVEADTIRRMYQHFCQHNVIVVAQFRNYSLQSGPLAHFQAFLVSLTYMRLDPKDSPCLGSQCVMIASESFHQSGGFDETYNAATVEDFELGYRMREQGRIIHIHRDAWITHNHHYLISNFFRNYYLKARDLTLLLLRNSHLRLSDTAYYTSSGLLAILLVFVGLLLAISRVVTGWQLFLLACLLLSSVAFLLRDFLNQTTCSCGKLATLVFAPLYGISLIAGGLGMAVGIVQFALKYGFQVSLRALYVRLIESLDY